MMGLREMAKAENPLDLLRFIEMVKYLSQFVSKLSGKAAGFN